jgi:hypothetical protein
MFMLYSTLDGGFKAWNSSYQLLYFKQGAGTGVDFERSQLACKIYQ